MTDTKQGKKTELQADVRALRPIGWLMGGVTALCAVMAVATGYWSQQQRTRDDFNHQAARPAATAQPYQHVRAVNTAYRTFFR